MFDDNVAAIRNTLKRFQALITPGRENEAISTLAGFVEPAHAALEACNFVELDRRLTVLVYEGQPDVGGRLRVRRSTYKFAAL
jgi:hypothetical protein